MATAAFQQHIRGILAQMTELQYWRQMPHEQQQQHVLALQHLVSQTLASVSSLPQQQQQQQNPSMESLINAHASSQGGASSSPNQPVAPLRSSPASAAQMGDPTSRSPYSQQQPSLPQPGQLRSESVPSSENMTPWEKLMQVNAHSISPSWWRDRRLPWLPRPQRPRPNRSG